MGLIEGIVKMRFVNADIEVYESKVGVYVRSIEVGKRTFGQSGNLALYFIIYLPYNTLFVK